MNFRFTPAPYLFEWFPLLINVGFFVAPKDIWVEKGFSTEGGHQPHS